MDGYRRGVWERLKEGRKEGRRKEEGRIGMDRWFKQGQMVQAGTDSSGHDRQFTQAQTVQTER